MKISILVLVLTCVFGAVSADDETTTPPSICDDMEAIEAITNGNATDAFRGDCKDQLDEFLDCVTCAETCGTAEHLECVVAALQADCHGDIAAWKRAIYDCCQDTECELNSEDEPEPDKALFTECQKDDVATCGAAMTATWSGGLVGAAMLVLGNIMV
jgi:hypothetical protein